MGKVRTLRKSIRRTRRKTRRTNRRQTRKQNRRQTRRKTRKQSRKQSRRKTRRKTRKQNRRKTRKQNRSMVGGEGSLGIGHLWDEGDIPTDEVLDQDIVPDQDDVVLEQVPVDVWGEDSLGIGGLWVNDIPTDEVLDQEDVVPVQGPINAWGEGNVQAVVQEDVPEWEMVNVEDIALGDENPFLYNIAFDSLNLFQGDNIEDKELYDEIVDHFIKGISNDLNPDYIPVRRRYVLHEGEGEEMMVEPDWMRDQVGEEHMVDIHGEIVYPHRKLTRQEINSLQRYTGILYSDLNAYMRGLPPVNWGGVENRIPLNTVKNNIDNAFKAVRPIETNFIVFRGVSLNVAQREMLEKKNREEGYYDNSGAYMSTSILRNVGERFLKTGGHDDNRKWVKGAGLCCFLIIHIPAGKRILPLEWLTLVGGEHEILLSSTARLKYLRKHTLEIPGTRGMFLQDHPLPDNEVEWPTLQQTYNIPHVNRRIEPPPFVKMNAYEYVLEQD